MKPKLLTYCSLTILLFTACSEEELRPVEMTTINDYAQLEVGNYWVYDWYEIQPDGSESLYGQRDTLRISEETQVDGRTYFIRSGTFLGQVRKEMIFDSAQSIYTYPDRVAVFSIDPTLETTSYFGLPQSPIAVGTYQLEPTRQLLQVPAGNFECLNFKGTIESLQIGYEHGTRFNDNWYAKDIGLVQLKTQFYALPSDLEMRLVAFGKL